MPPDREHPVWVLGLVGVAASALSAEGQFTVVDSAVGITLLLVLITVIDVLFASMRFKLAYSAVLGLCVVLIAGAPLSAAIVELGWAEENLLSATHEVDAKDGQKRIATEYAVPTIAVACFAVWLIFSVASIVVIKMLHKKNSAKRNPHLPQQTAG